ncbi:hypothetical protein CHUAL_013299 [Chamberlinius hualienensis]
MTSIPENAFSLEAEEDLLAAIDSLNDGTALYSVGTNRLIFTEELPPPYDIAVLSNLLSCQVCNAPIIIPENPKQFAAKCYQCHEHTLVRNSPDGKVFFRCVCHCLLSHKSTSMIVICPRVNCQKVHNFSGAPMYKVCCAYCKGIFFVPTKIVKRSFARCGHCRKRSAVTAKYIHKRGSACIGGGISVLIVMIWFFATAFQEVNENPPWYAFFLIFLAIAVCFMVRGCFILATKVSSVVDTV